MPGRRDVHSSFKLTAQIGGGAEIPLVAVELSFSVNQIPQGVITLPLGLNVRDQTESTAAGAVRALGYMTPMKIFLEASYDQERDRPWPPGRHVIFEGYTAGHGTRKMRGSTYATVAVVHWLSELTFSSMLTANLSPSNPGCYISPAVVSQIGTTSGKTVFASLAQAAGLTSEIRVDVWSGVKKFLVGVASDGSIQNRTTSTELKHMLSGDNKAALNALDRIVSDPSLALKLTGAAAEPIASAMCTYLGTASPEALLQSSFWSRIVGAYCPSFMFAIVPQAERCLAVPLLPGTRKLYQPNPGSEYAIQAKQYDQIQSSVSHTRPVKAVVINSALFSATGAVGSTIKVHEGGIYEPDDKAQDGLILFYNSPPWISSAIQKGLFAAAGLQARMVTGGVTGDDTPPAASSVKASELMDSSSDFLSLYAQTMYIQEATRQRTLSLSGRLRFDIAPGSTVKVEGKESAGGAATGGDRAADLICVVSAVTCSINAEAPSAGTSFRLSHLRSSKENESERTSVGSHPLYTEVWAGAPLVEGLR